MIADHSRLKKLLDLNRLQRNHTAALLSSAFHFSLHPKGNDFWQRELDNVLAWGTLSQEARGEIARLLETTQDGYPWSRGKKEKADD